MGTALDYQSPSEANYAHQKFGLLSIALAIAILHLTGTGVLYLYAVSKFDNIGSVFEYFSRIYELPMDIDAITGFFVVPKMGSAFGVDLTYVTIDAIVWGVIFAGTIGLIRRVKS